MSLCAHGNVRRLRANALGAKAISYQSHWQFTLGRGKLRVFTGEPLPELLPRRQDLRPTYFRNGSIYAFFRRTVEETGSFYGRRCVPYLMPADRSINIDTLDDWQRAETFLRGTEGGRMSARCTNPPRQQQLFRGRGFNRNAIAMRGDHDEFTPKPQS